MKKYILFLLVSLLSVTITSSVSAAEQRVDYRKVVKGSMTDTDGGVWKYDGWIEIGGFPPSLEHWDIWITFPDGTRKHFTGIAYNGGGNGDNGDNGGPHGYQSHLYDEGGHEIDLNLIPWAQLINELEEVASNSDPSQ